MRALLHSLSKFSTIQLVQVRLITIFPVFLNKRSQLWVSSFIFVLDSRHSVHLPYCCQTHVEVILLPKEILLLLKVKLMLRWQSEFPLQCHLVFPSQLLLCLISHSPDCSVYRIHLESSLSTCAATSSCNGFSLELLQGFFIFCWSLFIYLSNAFLFA